MKRDMENLIHQKLVDQYDKYYRLAYGYVRNEQDAMDVVQEAAYKAILHCDSLKNPEYADTWIYRIVMNEAVTLLRGRKKDCIPMEDMEISDMDRYRDFDLEKALDRLDAREKTVIMLRFFEELPLEQIAEVTDENLSTVKSRLYRTLKKLRLIMQV